MAMAVRIARSTRIGAAVEALSERLLALVGPASHRQTLAVSVLHVALIWVMALVVIWQNNRASIDTWKTSAEKISLTMATHAEQTQRAAELVLTGMTDWVSDENIQDERQFRAVMSQRRFFDEMRHLVVGVPQVGMVFIAAANGDVINSLSQWPAINANVADREGFMGAMQASPSDLVVTAPSKGITDGRWRFYLTRRLTTKSGATLGVVGVGLDAEYFAASFRRLVFGPDSWLSLFRSDGMLLATSLDNQDLLGKRYDTSLPHRMITAGKSGVAAVSERPFSFNPASSPTRIVVATEVQGFPAYVAAVVGESNYLAPLRSRNYVIVGIALLLTLLTALAALRVFHLIDRSEAVRRVEAQRQVLAAIVETPSALTAVVAATGKVLHYNNRFRDQLGRHGRVSDALFNPDLRGAPQLLDFVKSGDHGPIELDLEIGPADGQHRRFHFSLSRQSLPDIGDCVVMVGHDETQRHQAQQAIAMSARLVTLGELTTSIAHEVSQPLNVIRMAAQNALVESAPGAAGPDADPLPPMSDAEFRRFANAKFHRIVAQVDRAADILSRMRIFSRKPGEDGHVFEVCGALRNALGLMLPQLRRDGIRVTEDFPAEQLFVRGSQALVEQVLVYLLRNARDALAAQPPADRSVTVSAKHAGDRVLVRVADNGPGVPPDIRERIFEPFFTTKPNDKHTGLGLTLAFGAVRDSGGSLTLLPSTTGAVFQIDLPGNAPS
jgi:C4-dicarboxylate-specific signal transduction histidine kinase